MLATPIAVMLALSASAFGKIYTTAPVASTTWTGGQEAVVSWQDDNTTPSLADYGACTISIYVGNAQQQTQLQLIQDSVNVATTSTVKFTPKADLGASGNYYFIRFQSLALKDPAQPQYPALAFSSKFSIEGLSGSFNASVQAQIDGQSTAPIGGSTAASPSATTGASAATTAKPASTTAASGNSTASKTSSKASSPTGTNGASSVAFSGFAVAVAAAVVGVAFC